MAFANLYWNTYHYNMKRLIVVYNPRSSRYASVCDEVLNPLRKLHGYMVGKYQVAPTNIDDNIKQLAKIIKDDDLILSAGGDATGIIASNAILRSKHDAILAVLPYGNFNDLAATLRTHNLSDVLEISEKSDNTKNLNTTKTPDIDDFPTQSKIKKFYPLEIYVDGKFYRYATCYVTIGMTAEAVKLYDTPNMRRRLKTEYGRNITSYTELIRWYFKNRHTKQFIPDFKYNGQPQAADSSDYAAVNGRRMARVMKGREDYLEPKEFRSVVGRLTHFWRLFDLMAKSILDRVPGSPTTGDLLEFNQPSRVEIQAEGESKVFTDVQKIEIKKGTKWFRAVQN